MSPRIMPSLSRSQTTLNIPVNDLFGAITDAGRDSYLTPDGVHFTPEGCALLGKAVAEFVKPYLTTHS